MTAADLLRQALEEDPGYTPAGFGDVPSSEHVKRMRSYTDRGLCMADTQTLGRSAGTTRYLDVWGHGNAVLCEDTTAGVLYWDGPDPEPRVVAVTPVTTYRLASDENWRN